VLSQRSDTEGKLHPCAFSPDECLLLSRIMMLVTELLAIKLVLEEWRHWLEDAKQPFIVWTDHKNLFLIFKMLKDLIPIRIAGHCFLADLTSPFPIVQVPVMSSLMLCPDSLTLRMNPLSQFRFFLQPVWWEGCFGKLTTRFFMD